MKSILFVFTASTLLFCGSAMATPVGAGTFNLAGSAVGSTGGVMFYLNAQGDNQGIVVQPVSGAFSGLSAGTMETINPLTVANGVTPGSSFDFMNWVVLSDGINLDATSIPIPNFSVCPSSGSVAVGFECLVNASSPVVLTQNAGGVAAQFSVFGNAHFAGQTQLTPFTALLVAPSTNFDTIADFETYFDTNHTIPAVSYAASFTTTPEPVSLSLLAIGLVGIGVCRKRKTGAVAK